MLKLKLKDTQSLTFSFPRPGEARIRLYTYLDSGPHLHPACIVVCRHISAAVRCTRCHRDTETDAGHRTALQQHDPVNLSVFTQGIIAKQANDIIDIKHKVVSHGVTLA